MPPMTTRTMNQMTNPMKNPTAKLMPGSIATNLLRWYDYDSEQRRQVALWPPAEAQDQSQDQAAGATRGTGEEVAVRFPNIYSLGGHSWLQAGFPAGWTRWKARPQARLPAPRSGLANLEQLFLDRR